MTAIADIFGLLIGVFGLRPQILTAIDPDLGQAAADVFSQVPPGVATGAFISIVTVYVLYKVGQILVMIGLVDKFKMWLRVPLSKKK